MRINKILDLLIEFCYLAIVFLVPVYFALLLKTANVFELNKIVLFKVLVLCLILLTLIKIIFRRNAPRRVSTWRVFNKHLIIPLFFLLSLTLSTVLSINPETSFYGLYDRQQGLISHIYYFLFFLSLLFNIKTKKQIKSIMAVVVWSSLFVCLYGMAQTTGNDPFHWIESTKLRITSTFGQPNFLASYLLLVIPLSIYFICVSKRIFFKIIYSVVLILQLLCLFFTYSMSGWIGLIGGLMIVGVIYWFNKTRQNKLMNKEAKFSIGSLASAFRRCLIKHKKSLLVGFFIVSLAVAGIHSFRSPWTLKNKVKHLVNPQSGSTAARLQFWQAGWDAIKKRPLFGYGLETQREVLAGYYDKDWAVHSNVNVQPNRAHNLFLDILLTSGIVGLIAYLALLYLFGKFIFENIRNNQEKLLNIAILLSVICYLLSLMFNFSFVAGEIYFWLFLAVVILSRGQCSDKGLNSEVLGHKPSFGYLKLNSSDNQKLNPQSRSILGSAIITIGKLSLIILISMAAFYQIGKQIKVLIADYYFREIQVARFINNDFFHAYILYGHIKDLGIRDIYYQKQYALMLTDWITELDPYGIIFRMTGEKILADILPNIKLNNYEDYLARAKIYTLLAGADDTDDKEYYNLAKNNFNEIINRSPGMPRNYREFGKMYYAQGGYDKAVKSYDLALSKLPDLGNPYLNVSHKNKVKQEMFLNYIGIGDVHFKEENYTQAEENYNLAKGMQEKNILIYRKLADTHYGKGDFKQAIWYNEKGMELAPYYDYTWPLAIAEIYQETGDKQKALEYAEKAKAANGNIEIDEFIE